ncbi:MAG: BON domain-containing protein [Betaproteobacteria bacterium]|nr:MAG: BON domain-containing protein [Betaproteobacteria bacterium]
MKRKISMGSSTASCGLLVTAGCDVHRADFTTEVQTALAAERALRGSSIEVRKDGAVPLRGATSDAERRMLTAHVARAVQGVRVVRNEPATAGEA